MKKYTYTGNTPFHFEYTVKGELKEVFLMNGDVAELPTDHPVIVNLVEQGKLQPNTTKPKNA